MRKPCDICDRPAVWSNDGDSGESLGAYCRKHAPIPPESDEPKEGEPLTERETQLLELYGQGLTLAECGERMGLSRRQAKRLARHARLKLGATSTMTAVIEVLGAGYIEGDD